MKTKTKTWYSVIPYPKGYTWHGAKHAVQVLDAMENTAPVFSSQNKREAQAEAKRRFGLMAEILETPWNPAKFQVEFVYKPDTQKAVAGLQEVLRCAGM